jgi:hypothetical protein
MDILKFVIDIYNCDVFFPTYNSVKSKKCDFLAINIVRWEQMTANLVLYLLYATAITAQVSWKTALYFADITFSKQCLNVIMGLNTFYNSWNISVNIGVYLFLLSLVYRGKTT